MTEKTALTIRDAARKFGKQDQYIRKLIKEGKLTAEKVYISDTSVPRWEISVESLEAYFSSARRRTSRTDGRNKFVVYLNEGEHKALVTLMQKNGLKEAAALLVRANPPKAKAKAAKEPKAEPEPKAS